MQVSPLKATNIWETMRNKHLAKKNLALSMRINMKKNQSKSITIV